MVDGLCGDLVLVAERGILTSNDAAVAMSKVDRKLFVPRTGYAYNDAPQVIGFGATISAPHMVRLPPSRSTCEVPVCCERDDSEAVLVSVTKVFGKFALLHALFM